MIHSHFPIFGSSTRIVKDHQTHQQQAHPLTGRQRSDDLKKAFFHSKSSKTMECKVLGLARHLPIMKNVFTPFAHSDCFILLRGGESPLLVNNMSSVLPALDQELEAEGWHHCPKQGQNQKTFICKVVCQRTKKTIPLPGGANEWFSFAAIILSPLLLIQGVCQRTTKSMSLPGGANEWYDFAAILYSRLLGSSSSIVALLADYFKRRANFPVAFTKPLAKCPRGTFFVHVEQGLCLT